MSSIRKPGDMNVELSILTHRKSLVFIGYAIIKMVLIAFYFDSFGQVVPLEIQKYLKKKEKEFESSKAVIQRNTDIVQHVNTHVCRHLCLFALTSLTHEHLSYQDMYIHC